MFLLFLCTLLSDSNPGYAVWTNSHRLLAKCIPACYILHLWKFTSYGKSKMPRKFFAAPSGQHRLSERLKPSRNPKLQEPWHTLGAFSSFCSVWHNGWHWKASILILRFDDLPPCGLQNSNVSVLPYLTRYSFSHSCYLYGCAGRVG